MLIKPGGKMERIRSKSLIIIDYWDRSVFWGHLERKGKGGNDDPVIGGESSFSPGSRCRKIEACPRPARTKVASSSLKRVTEAEPTFASAWNRATGPFPIRAGHGLTVGPTGRARGWPAYFPFPKMRKPIDPFVSRRRKRQPDNDSIRILLRVRITRIEEREKPSII